MSILKNNINSIYNIDEKLITFGGKTNPKFGQVVILAGGAGSGKGFIKKSLLGVEGITFDVDRLKELVMASTKYVKKAKEEFDVDVSKLNLKNKDDVSKLHDIVTSLGINDKKIKSVFNSVVTADPTRKPNLIFDVTLKDITKLYNLVRNVEDMGYLKKNISLVWVVNQIDIAKAQNAKRSRTVSPEILLATHEGASFTMNTLIRKGDDITKFLDGDVVIAFNAVGVDSELVKSDKGGKYVKKADYIRIKEKLKPMIKFRDMEDKVLDKIKRYVPNSYLWDK